MRRLAPFLVLGCMAGLAQPATAQSTHLLALESASPATTPDLVSALAWPGWAGLWANPSAEPELLGVLVGAEHNSFGGVRTGLAQVAFHAGARWSVALAQTSVSDLFEPELLAQDPLLAELRATALTLAVDAAGVAARGLAMSAGMRLERDELLGERAQSWVARLGGTAALARDARLAVTLERVVGGDVAPAGTLRARFGAAASWSRGLLEGTIGLGGEAGGLWRRTRDGRSVSLSAAIRLRRALVVGGSLGAERDLYGARAWNRRTGWWVGLTAGPLALQLRLASQLGDAPPVLAGAGAFTAGGRARGLW